MLAFALSTVWLRALLPNAAAADDNAPLAPAVIVWTEGQVPSAEVQGKVALLTAGGQQVAWGDIAYAPGDRTQADRMRIDAIQTAEDAGRKHWDEFDVELGIAQALRTTIDAVDLVTDDNDRNALVHALALESTAVMRSFPVSNFATVDTAAPFREVIGDMVASHPMVDLVALDPDHAWTREELGDGQILARIQAYQAAVKALPPGTIHFDAAPPGASLLVDGRPLAAGTADATVVPGHHYVAVLAGGKVSGRGEFEVSSGATIEVPALVTAPQLADAKAATLSGKLDGLSPDFAKALTAIPLVDGKVPRVYLASVDDKGHGHVVPWSPGATLIRPKPVSVMLCGDVGGGFLNSPAFAQQAGAIRMSPQFGPQLSGQFGVYNVFLNAGGTVDITPGYRFASGGTLHTPNLIPAGVRAWGGLGLYLPRPTRGVPLLSVGVNYGAFFPGSTGFGGSLTFGAPVSDGKTWVRFSLDGFRSVEMPAWTDALGIPAGSVSYAGAFRIGFGRLF